jgi:hypothetical protein
MDDDDDASGRAATVSQLFCGIVAWHLVFVGCTSFKFNNGFVTIFISHVCHCLNAPVWQSYVIFASGGVAMSALLVTEIVVMVVFDGVLPIVIGLHRVVIGLGVAWCTMGVDGISWLGID